MTKIRRRSQYRTIIAASLLAAGALSPITVLAAPQESWPHSAPGSGIERELSAQWWQLVLSVPPDVNPVNDPDGKYCVVGQRGPVWFLYGTFGSGAPVRDCSVPEGTALFVPVVNYVNINTPGFVCGQVYPQQSVRELRRQIAPIIDGAMNLSMTLDGSPVRIGPNTRVRSVPFDAALPDANVFGCLAGGIYSPAVDDGHYVLLAPLHVGRHTLSIHGELPDAGSVVDVTYILNVVPVSLK